MCVCQEPREPLPQAPRRWRNDFLEQCVDAIKLVHSSPSSILTLLDGDDTTPLTDATGAPDAGAAK